MKKTLLFAAAIVMMVLCSAQDVWAKCETIITVPSTACIGQKVSLSLSDDPCDCIKYTDVEWIIIDPSSTTTVIMGTPISYIFSMAGTYKVCVKWYDYCYGETYEKCYEVVVTSCCTCDMKISENTSTTNNAGGYIEGSFYINSGSKKVVGMEVSVPFWNYNFEASGCKFDCDKLITGYSLGNIVKYSDVNGYYPTPTGCFGEDWAREVDWTFPSPQYIDQTFKYVITVPPTDCYMDYYYCVKVLLHYDDCTTCECTFCFKADKVICSCEPAGKAAAKSDTKASGLTMENVKIFPNPNGGQFTVQMEKTAYSKVIAVMDMTGKIVLKSIVSGDKANMELNSVAPGTYNVVITGGGKTVTKRVVIAK